jgi:hypothetical protein
MRTLTLLAFLILALPGTALAAPPANDNRADAEAIPAFPRTLTATTAEATVERFDPQVSRCGRIESTLWYRIDTAPDGLIALTVKRAAGVAPVLRIYRRAGSTIQEVDCASAGPGGSRDGRILLRLSAAGQLDAAIVVLERVRSQFNGITCGVTNQRGLATVSFASRRGGSPVTLRPEVANGSSGPVEIQIDRFDPLTGWHFNRLLRVPAGGSTTWAPPAEGRWRPRATYKGTIEASPSRSGYALLLVKQS